jgi:ketosteroid isomerase-like protein
MKKVASVVARLVRAVGRILAKILRPLRSLRGPLVQLTQLRGRPLIVACGLIFVLLVLFAIALKPEPDQEKEVRAALDRYAKASRDKDYQTLCDDLLASQLVEQIRSAGLPCEVALRTGLENRRNMTLVVLKVQASGDEAAADVRTTATGEPTSVDTIRLVRQDDAWRVRSLQQPGAGSRLPGAGP